ncbi:MAG: putative lipid II flippase FtsW [Lachnospiraceae bacterium]|nr:putative lipid II flippase FtsW [Lachnospiraceae bacterium]
MIGKRNKKPAENKEGNDAVLLSRPKIIAGDEVSDYRMIVSVIFLLMFGLIMIYSASSASSGLSPVFRQLLFIGIGMFGMFVASRVNYHWLVRHAWPIFVLAFLSVFLVRVPGLSYTSHGASRWIEIFGFTIQPAEFLKPGIILLMSYILVKEGAKLKKVLVTIKVMIPAVISAGVVLIITSNLSTAIIIFGIAAIMLFVAFPGRKVWAWIGVILLAVIIAAYAYFNLVLKPADEQNTIVSEQSLTEEEQEELEIGYRTKRILAWIYPEKYSDESLQTRYSMYAIGYGGVFGRGLGNGTVKYVLPEPTNDFIFAVIAEELGIAGCLAVMVLFIYQIWRIIEVARHAPDRIGCFVAAGVGIHISLQAIFNIGVAMNVFPNTGISLPYISAGGSALILQLAEVGMVLNVSRQIHGKRITVSHPEVADIIPEEEMAN